MAALTNLLTTLAGLWPLWLPLVAGGLAIYLLLPRPRPYPAVAGALVGGLALFLLAALLLRTSGLSAEVVLFYAFSALAIGGAAMLVTQRNPARAALSFTLVVLSTCGLFLLLAAPFLMAATIIVYAGAIIVTFLFVLMLAQQAALSDADARSREPLLATLTGFLLLAAMLYVLRGYEGATLDDLVRRIDRALDQDDRESMLPFVEPKQNDAERDRESRKLFDQSKNLLFAAGLREAAELARQYAGEWDFAELDEPDKAGKEETTRKSPLALENLRELLKDNEAVVRERLMLARLPAGDDKGEGVPGARKTPLPLSGLSGPPAGTLPGEIRRDPDTKVPHLPAENAAYLGRSLFTDYLLPVELGGLLLLVATVGAIAIAQRREAIVPPAGQEARRNA